MMVRLRAYRHDVRCPDCGSNWMAKAGHSKVRRLRPYLSAGRGVSSSGAGAQRGGGADVPGRQQRERGESAHRVQRSGGVGVAQKGRTRH